MEEIRNEYKKKIDELSSKTFNLDQKELAKKMIEVAPIEDISNWFSFIINRIKLGFRFDSAPDVNKQFISLLEEDKIKRINVSDKVSEDENKLIIGDNYDVLKNLLITHKGKIDIIYIDPPYNTESSFDDGNVVSYKEEEKATKFIYRDKYSRTGWLNMMNERLKLAMELLSDEGVIFVSIDDAEQAYLKVLMDEIFGEENFVNQINWINNKTGRQLSEFGAAKTYEYILVYSSNNSNVQKFIIDKSYANNEMPDMYVANKSEIEIDDIGEFIIEHELYQRNTKINEETSPTLCYDIIWNKFTNTFTPIDLNSDVLLNDDEMIFRCKANSDGKHLYQAWRWGREKVIKDGEKELVVRKTKTGELRIYSKKRSFSHTMFKDSVTNITTQNGRNDLLALGIDHFHYPKPLKLIEILLMLFNKNSTILDFFAGSGTTGQAVMELNKQDGGNRKFILCTNNENQIADKITYERLFRVINGKGTQNESFPWADKNEPYKKEKLRVFYTKIHNVSIDKDIDALEQKAIEAFKKIDPSYESKNEFDILNQLNSLHPYEDEGDK